MGLRDQRRADRVADREQDRLDRQAETQAAAEAAQAQAEADAVRQRAADESRQAAAAQRRTEQQAQREHAEQVRARRRQVRQERLARLRQWAGGHVVELLVYPLALVSAVVAIPAMAGYGSQVYDTGTGWALPALTELGMWAFALAVQASRARDPQRPVWSLQTGVWLFGAVALALNALHGAQRGLDAAVVMGVASVAGVVAHQLVTASPRRSAAERAEARRTRRERRKRARIEALATRQAVAELDSAGRARLVYRPGLVTITTGRFRRPRLTSTAVPGREVAPAADGWDAALATLAETGPDTGRDETVSGVSGAGHSATAVTVAESDPAEAEPCDPSLETPHSDRELAALVEAALDAQARGELSRDPSQRQVRETLGIRASRAGQVQRALRETDQH